LTTKIRLKDLNQAYLVNPRNAYQNYNVAVNLSKRVIYTYLGILQPKMGNANYSSAGQLSPLLNDPYLRTIGVGTRIFLGGGIGYVFWEGTQHNPTVERSERGVPLEGAGTLSLTGDMKGMSNRYIRGVSMLGYGVSLAVGIGVPIPILDEEMVKFVSVRDDELYAPAVDYSKAYPDCEGGTVARVSYSELKSGTVTIKGKKVATGSLSSYPMAVEIANTLKKWIEGGSFLLTQKVASLPDADSGQTFKPMRMMSDNEAPA
jgi:uncharacterized protein (DUF39 family)